MRPGRHHRTTICGRGFFRRAIVLSRRWQLSPRPCIATLLAASLFLLPAQAFAWGENADRLIVNSAIGTLPDELRPFFEANRQFLQQHISDPDDAAAKSASERQFQFIRLDHYGQYPFASLPRDYKDAVRKFGKRSLDSNGLLPWEIGLYSAKLTDAFRAGNWSEAQLDAALLASYVADAHDPFRTTINYDGHLSGQIGVEDRFGNRLVSRYSQFFYLHPNPAALIADPTDRAFEICLTSHSWLENVLLADRRARQGVQDYNDEFYDHFYGQAGAVLVRQISDAATDVGSYWLTAWENAGRPHLPVQ
ncbi:MAG TPA: hypothetical protein VGT03_04570 [Candidatus Acidoferrales bacterium]|nr:hypothetical protein [Candidatus Acidoferrales bacterium]